MTNPFSVDSWECDVSLSGAGQCSVEVSGSDAIEAGDNAIRRLIERDQLEINCQPKRKTFRPTRSID